MAQSRRQRIAQQSLLNFALWYELSMTANFSNCLELKRAKPHGLKNPVLLFVVPRAMNHVVERAVLEIEFAWCLLNEELKRQKRRGLGVSDRSYRHLKRIRNKLVAHRVENLLKAKRHLAWYQRAYGSFESILALVRKVGGRVHDKVRALEAEGHLRATGTSAKHVAPFSVKDVEAIFGALKGHGIY
jgi:hypothetical protein